MAAPPKHNPRATSRPLCIVSACLAGIDCTFRGGNKRLPAVSRLVRNGSALPVCPEVMGGLATPRENAEIVGGGGEEVLAGAARVVSISGRDLTRHYLRGAAMALAIARRAGITRAILKSKSPACGCGRIYDGTFREFLTAGNGVLAALLLRHGFTVLTERDIRRPAHSNGDIT